MQCCISPPAAAALYAAGETSEVLSSIREDCSSDQLGPGDGDGCYMGACAYGYR